MDGNLLFALFVHTIRSSIPLTLAAIGGTFSIRSGVSDLGLEGMILSGAFFAVYGSHISGNEWVGLSFGVIAGVLISLLHAIMHVVYHVNATISGMCVNLFAAGITPLLLDTIFGMSGKSLQVESFGISNNRFINGLPLIGRLLSQLNIFFYLTIVVVVASWIFIFKSKRGMRMRMVGENPRAANTVGLNVVGYKFFGVIMSGIFAGMAGAYLSLGQLNLFVENMSSGRGYIAVVINAFGHFNPIGAMAGSIFFGFFDAVQSVLHNIFPSQLVMMLPYILTFIVITFGIKKSATPAGVGKFH